MKVLVRNNTESSEILQDSEFIDVALEQISTVSLSLKDATESEQILNGMADMLELMQDVLMKHNINPTFAIQHAASLREELGSFKDKKVINKE